jgi:DNA-binding transcriptional MerR regulator
VTELSIGDFSRMTFLTVKALRHYHDVGLLEPARTDPSTGYRYYAPAQVAEARLIRRLRDLDLPVEEVKAVLSAPDEPTRDAVLVEHLDRMSRQLAEVQGTVESLRRMLSPESEELAITYRDMAPQLFVAITEPVTGEEVVAWWLEAFGELHRFVRSHGLTRAGTDGTAFPTAFFTDGVAELTAFVPVDRIAGLSGRVEALSHPGGRFAVARHDGPMVDLDAAYSAAGRAALEQALASDGPVVERYLPLGDPDDLLAHATEVCWPVGDQPGSGQTAVSTTSRS